MKNILLTGIPRIGKTTVIQKIVRMTRRPCAGFYTEEIREHNRRVGFGLTTVDHKHCILSHKNIKSQYHVGQYSVAVNCLEKIGVAAIRKGIERGNVIVIDEIGKMELFSKKFRDIVLEALDAPAPVLATILSRPHTFCDAIKNRHDVEIIEVSETNRNALPVMIREKLKR